MFPAIQPIPLLKPADYQAGSQDFDSINMGLLRKVDILIQLGAITGDGPWFKLYSGATAGAKTTELAFKYRLSTADSPAASADVFGARVAVAAGGSGLVFTASADFDNRTIWIEFHSDQMTDGHKWLTIESDDGSASGLLVSSIAIGWPRYGGDTPPTAL